MYCDLRGILRLLLELPTFRLHKLIIMKNHTIRVFALLTLCCTTQHTFGQGEANALPTVAEKSNYTKTSTHAEVVAFCEQLVKKSPHVRLTDIGVTKQGRKLPMLILADPPVATPEEAKRSGKLIVFAMGNIHAGEVDGKEALLALARDLALAKNQSLFKDLIVLLVPNFNADGGDKTGEFRKSQAGPAVVGTRENADGFDLNRDFVKLETPECQALIRMCRLWDPAIVIDCHTTNGSYHQYALTYDTPRHPSNEPIRDFGRDVMLPEFSKRLQKASGYKSFYYGNFAGTKNDPKSWTTTPAEPRYGFHYQGFRNRLGILSESYSNAPYRDRVLASYGFVKVCFEYAADHQIAIRKLLADSDKANRDAPAGTKIALRHRTISLPEKMTVLGLQGGKTIELGAKPVDYKLDVVYKTEATLAVDRPYAYLVPASFTRALENLERHGVELDELRRDAKLNVEAYRIDKIKASKPFQKHSMLSVDATPLKDNRTVKAGTIVVRTNQRLGTLASFWLEPQAEDGLTTWNFFDPLQEGQEFPVLRLPAQATLSLVPRGQK